MTKDVKGQVSEAPVEAPVEVETTEPAPQPEKQTAEPTETKGEVKEPVVVEKEPESLAPEPAPEKTIPYSRFQEINKKFRELQRKTAEEQGARKLEGVGPEDWEAIMSHPFVQDLLIKDAKRELTDYAREVLEQYPTLHQQVKKAILANARGFINETTTDVESAKIDLLDYIEGIAEEDQAQSQVAPPKTFPIADTNTTGKVESKARPAEIQKILEKPVDSWTEDEAKTVEEYSRSIPKK